MDHTDDEGNEKTMDRKDRENSQGDIVSFCEAISFHSFLRDFTIQSECGTAIEHRGSNHCVRNLINGGQDRFFNDRSEFLTPSSGGQLSRSPANEGATRPTPELRTRANAFLWFTSHQHTKHCE